MPILKCDHDLSSLDFISLQRANTAFAPFSKIKVTPRSNTSLDRGLCNIFSAKLHNTFLILKKKSEKIVSSFTKFRKPR